MSECFNETKLAIRLAPLGGERIEVRGSLEIERQLFWVLDAFFHFN
jgi:hypothetical protein